MLNKSLRTYSILDEPECFKTATVAHLTISFPWQIWGWTAWILPSQEEPHLKISSGPELDQLAWIKIFPINPPFAKPLQDGEATFYPPYQKLWAKNKLYW